MEYDVFNKYPDYLQDFDEIQALCEWQWEVIYDYLIAIKVVYNNLKVHYFPGDCWKAFVKIPSGCYLNETILSFHKKYEVTTLEILRSYVEVWIASNDFTLEYDKDAMTITLTVGKSFYDTIIAYKRIRNVLPCNMELIVNLT